MEQKVDKIQFLEDKRGTPDSKIVEEMNRLDPNKIASKDNCDRTMNSFIKHLIIIKTLKIEILKLKLLNKCFALIMAYLWNNFIIIIYLFIYFCRQSHLIYKKK